MRSEKKELSVVIPAYNEKEAIIDTVQQVILVLISTDIDFELIVVNDGSTDKTGEILQEYLNKNDASAKNVRLINHKFNKGYGAALKSGILKAKYNNICIIDADGTYPNNKIPLLFNKYLSGPYDMIIGRRPFEKLPTITKPAKWFLTVIASYLAGAKIPDLNSGLRIFKKDVILIFFPIISDGFSFTTTSTLAMITNSYEIDYMDIDYLKRRGKTKIKPVKDTLNFIQIIIRTILYFNPLRIFLPLSVVLFLIGAITFIIGLFFGYFFENSFTILFVGSIQLLAIGMLADLINKKYK